MDKQSQGAKFLKMKSLKYSHTLDLVQMHGDEYRNRIIVYAVAHNLL